VSRELLTLVCVAVEYELLILSHDQPLNAVISAFRVSHGSSTFTREHHSHAARS